MTELKKHIYFPIWMILFSAYRYVLFSPILSLFKAVQSYINSLWWLFFPLVEWNMHILLVYPVDRSPHRTLTAIRAVRMLLWHKQGRHFPRRRCLLCLCRVNQLSVWSDYDRVRGLLCLLTVGVITTAFVFHRRATSVSILCINSVTDAFRWSVEWQEGTSALWTLSIHRSSCRQNKI